MSDKLDKEVLMKHTFNVEISRVRFKWKFTWQICSVSARNAELIIGRFFWFQFIFMINAMLNAWINQDSTMISEVSGFKCE